MAAERSSSRSRSEAEVVATWVGGTCHAATVAATKTTAATTRTSSGPTRLRSSAGPPAAAPATPLISTSRELAPTSSLLWRTSVGTSAVFET